MIEVLLNTLQQCRQAVMQESLSGNHRRQYHPDLSPAGWHLGHCVFTENYWIREVLLGKETCSETDKSLYIPEHSVKPERGASLPDKQDLQEWADDSYAENDALLKAQQPQQDLMQDGFLLHFLIQHYAQHLETLKLTHCQAALHGVNGKPVTTGTLTATPLRRDAFSIPADEYRVGRTTPHRPYDNESPAHRVKLDTVHIALYPVNNSEYLRFMQDDGYRTRRYWTGAGWQWLQDHPVECPEYWRSTSNDDWYAVSRAGPASLDASTPVRGINYHEATAFANWAGARLPHEHEWEVANASGLLQDTGRVWEWCENSFYPYAGFCPWPYEGYSVPYFDGAHFTLKGGSELTQPVIKRDSFRNYYEADKRFLFAGLRLVFN